LFYESFRFKRVSFRILLYVSLVELIIAFMLILSRLLERSGVGLGGEGGLVAFTYYKSELVGITIMIEK
jgi:hypothetical protein